MPASIRGPSRAGRTPLSAFPTAEQAADDECGVEGRSQPESDATVAIHLGRFGDSAESLAGENLSPDTEPMIRAGDQHKLAAGEELTARCLSGTIPENEFVRVLNPAPFGARVCRPLGRSEVG